MSRLFKRIKKDILAVIIFGLILLAGPFLASASPKHLIFIGSFDDNYNFLYYKNVNEALLSKMTGSPFDGSTALMIPYPNYCNFDTYGFEASAAARNAIRASEKKIWPRINISNVATTPCCAAAVCHANNPESVLDVWDEQGSMTKYKELMAIALRMAKDTNTPGIVIDPEMYDNYENYKVGYIAEKKGKTAEEVHTKLIEIGYELADIVNAEYPEAVLWMTFSDFSFNHRSYTYSDSYKLLSPVYIHEGMLMRAKERGYNFKLIEGGEIFPGYFNKTYEQLIQLSDIRLNGNLPFLEKYPNFKLGASRSIYLDKNYISLWQWDLSQVAINTKEDFVPLFRYIYDHNDYVWFYRGWAGCPPGYSPNPNNLIYKDCEYNDFDMATSSSREYRQVVIKSLCGDGVCEAVRGESPESCPTECGASSFSKSDLNQDGLINSSDLDILKADFLRLTANLANPRSDINADGQCTARDLGILMSGWK